MNTRKIIASILNYQNKPQILPGATMLPVTLTLKNGNIVLKEFRILEMDGNTIVGLTRQEEYIAHRENREPVYCRFRLDEIQSVDWMNS